MKTPRVRMFAGPNGSGKSTLNEILPEELKGVYLNPDDLEKRLASQGILRLSDYGLDGTAVEIFNALSVSPRLAEIAQKTPPAWEKCSDNELCFDRNQINSYVASVIVETMRKILLGRRMSFTFETVMSHESKVEFLEKARATGYRTYLYFIATEDPDINVSRVANRVDQGGHPVPEAKIRSRYDRSLSLLYRAIKASDRAYIFDNSSDGRERAWIAQIDNGKDLTFKAAEIPTWFNDHVIKNTRPA